MIISNDFEYGLSDSGSYNLLVSAVVAAILIGALLFVSGFGIISAFSANVDERKRQIGMLRAVGATKKQIRGILRQEIFWLTIVSMPPGFLLSFLAVKIGTGYMGDMFEVTINVPIILGIVAFSLLCIVISASIPLGKASAIPPMQAIREAELSVKLKKKSIKNKAIYNAEKHIAKRKIKLYKSHRITISIFIALAVSVLVLAVGYGPAFVDAYSGYVYKEDFGIRTSGAFSWDKIIQYGYNSPGITESDRQEIQKIIGDGAVYGEKRIKVNLQVDRISDFIINACGGSGYCMGSPDSHMHDSYEKYKEIFRFDKEFITVDCVGADESIIENLEPLVYEGRIDIDKISSGEEVIMLAAPRYGISYHENGGFSMGPVREGAAYDEIYENGSFHAGDEIDVALLYTDEYETAELDSNFELGVKDVKRIDNTVTIGALVYIDASVYFPFYPNHMISILTTQSGFSELNYKSTYKSILAKLNYVPDSETQKSIENVFSRVASYTKDTRFTSYLAVTEADKRMTDNIVKVIAALFILFSCMSIGMINNALSARIHSSKFMIGTMRAVGAPQDSIQRIFMWQLINMIKTGVIAGALVSSGLFICMVVLEPVVLGDLKLPWALISLAGYTALLFLICFYNIHKKTNKYLKRSIITNIREL
jgi:ABC-type antimicrobial peptide transport system permease subunit